MPHRFCLFCFILLATSAFTGAAATYFEITDNEGNSLFGTIAELNQTQIVVDVQGETQTIPLEKLVKIRNLAPNPYERNPSAAGPQNLAQVSPYRPYGYEIQPSAGRNTNDRRSFELLKRIQQANAQSVKKTFPGSIVALELKDGSRLTASSFTVAKSQGVCRLLDQQNDLSIPLENISAVRFAVRSLLETVNSPADWLRLAVPNTAGDRLIVGSPGSFDVYAGILDEVNDETVSFAVDGEVLPVPRRRVFGLVFHGEATPLASTSPLATLSLWTGTRGMVSDIQLKENELIWKTSAGLTVAVPLDMVSDVDFGEQGIAYLFDFERTRKEFTLPFTSDVKLEQLKLLQTFYESRTRNSRQVMLDGVVYDQGITLHGKTLLEYPLSKPFVSLQAVIGIEDQFRPYASANLQILANSQVLGSWGLRGDGTSQQIHLNLPQNCQLLTIIVEPVPLSNTPSILTIAEPKLFE